MYRTGNPGITFVSKLFQTEGVASAADMTMKSGYIS